MSSAFVRPGQSAANQQAAQQGLVAKGAAGILGSWNGLVQNQANYAAGLEPQRQRAVGQLIHSFSPQAGHAAAASQKNAAFANLQRAVNQARVSGAGFGPGFMQGNQLALSNQAAQQANQIDQQYASPQYQQQQLGQLLSVLNQAQELPGLGAYSGLAGLVYGQPPVQVGAGLGDIAGGLLGQSIGAGAFNRFWNSSPKKGATNANS